MKASKLLTTSAPTASLQWKSLPLHAESGFCPADPFLPCAERAIPNYNVMGLAKASLEETCAIWRTRWVRKVCVLTPSCGSDPYSGGFRYQRLPQNAGHCEAVTPIRRTVTIEDVGNLRHSCAPISLPVSPVKWSTLRRFQHRCNERTRTEIIVLLVRRAAFCRPLSLLYLSDICYPDPSFSPSRLASG